jgi:hypothetical protein
MGNNPPFKKDMILSINQRGEALNFNMNTNQKMRIQIGSFGTLEIEHLTQMGSVSQVMEMGNARRKAKGLSELSIKDILRKQDFWEFVISRNTKIARQFKSTESGDLKTSGFIGIDSDYSELKKFKTEKGEILYSELITKFPHLIKSKRGKYGGTFAELYILLKVASTLDKDLEVEIYDVFINSKILFWRDLGGDNFKEFNKIVDTLSDRIGENNQGVYIQVAKKIRNKLDILSTKGYNEKEHHAFIQQKRTEYLSNLTSMVNVGLIKTYPQLKEIIDKL